VAARDVERARAFADKFGFPDARAYGSYEQLADDEELDVIYVATINPLHAANVRLFLEKGRNVLCEKPMGMNVKETRRLIALAKLKGAFFMEGMWSRCLPAHRKLKEAIDEGQLGNILQVDVNFGRVIDAPRLFDKALGGGATLDLGVYVTHFILSVMNGDRPLKVSSLGHLNHADTDLSSSTAMTFSDGRAATMVLHAGADLPCEAVITGSRGHAKIPFMFHASSVVDVIPFVLRMDCMTINSL